MKIKDILKNGFEGLKDNQIEDYFIIARILLAYVLNKPKTYLVMNQDEDIDDAICQKYNELLEDIINGKPLQYITNHQEFMGLDFFVNEDVLIPQPDTEILVEKVLSIAKNNYQDEVSILDLCTGSGAIAISLYGNLVRCNIYASDISEAALKIAQKNAINNNANISFKKSDLFDNFKEYKFDIIVSNPPYIKTDEIQKLSKQVKNEPHLALDGGKDGLKFYKKIVKESSNFLSDNGFLCLEIGYDQAEEVVQILKEKYKNIEVLKDLSGNNRCVIARKE